MSSQLLSEIPFDVGKELAPFVRWTSDSECLSIWLVCPTLKGFDVHPFFYEMVSVWLRRGQGAEIDGVSFSKVPYPDPAGAEHYVGKIDVRVLGKAQLFNMERDLPALAEEIVQGVRSPSIARQIIETKGVSTDHKGALVCRQVARMQQRWGGKITKGVFLDLQHVLLLADDEFRRVRDVRHLSRIVCGLHRVRQTLLRPVNLFPDRRHVAIKLLRAQLQLDFSTRPVVGVMVAVNITKNYELIEEEHLSKAAEAIVPRARLVPQSTFGYQRRDDPIRLLYFELECKEGGALSLAEIKQIAKELPAELQPRIAQLTHSLFMPRNEEEVLRSTLVLSRELRDPADIPQVVVSFQGQKHDSLSFSVILVRLLKKGEVANSTFFEKLPKGVRWHVEEERVVGQLEKELSKMATVLTLTFAKGSFLRKDHAVDLFRARQHVMSMLGGLFGDLRDYNGGLMLKQSEVLLAVKRALGPQGKRQEHLLENLFYSLSPAVMQSYLQPPLVGELFQMLLKLAQREPDRQAGYLLESSEVHQSHLILARAEGSSFREEVQQGVEALGIDPLRLATVFLNVQGSFYLGYLYLGQEASVVRRLNAAVEKRLKGWIQKARGKQRLRVNLPRSALRLDPRVGADRRSGVIIKMLYEGLMRLGPDGVPVPGIAERYEVSEDGLTYRFFLRESVWSNNLPVTARDFEYAWKKMIDPQFRSRFAYLFDVIRNARSASRGHLVLSEVGITAEGERSLRVELEHPAPYFLELITHWVYSPLPAEIDQRQPGWAYSLGDAYTCNGPFKLAEVRHNHELSFRANSRYWDAESVELKRIEVSAISDADVALESFEQGELDWVGAPLADLPGAALPRLAKEGRLQSSPTAATHWYEFNTERTPFRSKEVRQAFGAALNRRALLEEVGHIDEELAWSVLPEGMGSARLSGGDEETARSLFKEGIAEQNLLRLAPITLTHPASEKEEALARAAARQWTEVLGVEIVLESLPWKQYMERLFAKDFQMASITWYSWYHDPRYNLERFRHRNNSFNSSMWESPDFTKLLDEANWAADPVVSKARLREAEQILLEEMPVCPVYYPRHHYVRRESVQGVVVTDFGHVDFKWAKIER